MLTMDIKANSSCAPSHQHVFLKFLVCVENKSPSFVKMTIEAEKMT